MKALSISALLVLLVFLTNCATTTTSKPKVENASKASSLAPVVGLWRFSHAGPPSIITDAMPDLTAQTNKNMKGAKMSIDVDGNTSFVALGQSVSGTGLQVLEETPLYLKLGAEGYERAYTYDKSSKVLTMPMDLDVDGSKGIMPAYFKRTH